MADMIYKVPGQHKGPKGTTYSFRTLYDGEKIPKGWHGSLVEAVDAFLPPEEKPKRKRRTKAEIEADKAAKE